MLFNTIEDPLQLLAPNILDELHVVLVNGDMAAINQQELTEISIANNTTIKQKCIKKLTNLPIVRSFTAQHNNITEASMRIRNLKDLPTHIKPEQNKLSKAALERKICGIIQPGGYTIFMSRNDALIGQNLFAFDYEQKQKEFNDKMFTSVGNETGGDFSQSLRVSFDRKPNITVAPLKDTLPNVYSLLNVYVTTAQLRLI